MSNLVRERLEEYFASMNPTSKRMMADIVSSRQKCSNDWDTLPEEEQSNILWRSIVKPEALEKYEKEQPENIDTDYFPVLRIRPGEKIVVDEDATAGRPFGCTWRDEHSAPFRWETQSQLDLHLDGEESDTERIRTLEKPPPEKVEPEKKDEIKKDEIKKDEVKKDDEMKRPVPVKRPEVPPPPVPPHFNPPIPPHVAESPPPPPLPQAEQQSDTPIYAKVVKRKSANAKTLVMSDMKAHRRAKEEMKPAVPPRMSLELKGEINISKYKTLPIDFDDIPKTGFDFLDNW